MRVDKWNWKIIELLHKGNSEPFKFLIARRYDDSISESNSSYNQDCLPFAFHYLGLSWCAWRSQTNWVYDKPNVSEENLDESGLTQCVTHIDEKLIVPRQGIRCLTKEVSLHFLCYLPSAKLLNAHSYAVKLARTIFGPRWYRHKIFLLLQVYGQCGPRSIIDYMCVFLVVKNSLADDTEGLSPDIFRTRAAWPWKHKDL